MSFLRKIFGGAPVAEPQERERVDLVASCRPGAS